LTAYSVSTLLVIWPYHFWRHFEVTIVTNIILRGYVVC